MDLCGRKDRETHAHLTSLFSLAVIMLTLLVMGPLRQLPGSEAELWITPGAAPLMHSWKPCEGPVIPS